YKYIISINFRSFFSLRDTRYDILDTNIRFD
ncbi:unnamed protein product, partial [marine sediment metagenome]